MQVDNNHNPSALFFEVDETEEMIEAVIELKSNKPLPIKVVISGDVVNFPTIETAATVAQTLLLKMGPESEEPLFQVKGGNGNWQRFHEIFTGELTAGIECLGDVSTAQGQVSFELNYR